MVQVAQRPTNVHPQIVQSINSQMMTSQQQKETMRRTRDKYFLKQCHQAASNGVETTACGKRKLIIC